jgi:hypothetical protein
MVYYVAYNVATLKYQFFKVIIDNLMVFLFVVRIIRGFFLMNHCLFCVYFILSIFIIIQCLALGCCWQVMVLMIVVRFFSFVRGWICGCCGGMIGACYFEVGLIGFFRVFMCYFNYFLDYFVEFC